MKNTYVITFQIAKAEQNHIYIGHCFEMNAEIDDEQSAKTVAQTIYSHVGNIVDEFEKCRAQEVNENGNCKSDD